MPGRRSDELRASATRRRGAVIACCVAAAGLAATAVAGDAPTSGAREALALCHSAANAPAAERVPILDRAFTLADAAVAADPGDPVAHFAVFCALGRRLEMSGFSFGALRAFRRMRAEIDTTLALAPDYVDAIIGKGAMLGEAPRFAGGDLDESERLLRQGVELAPGNADAHLHLARTLLAEGRRAEARTEADRALTLARERNPVLVATAERLIADAQ